LSENNFREALLTAVEESLSCLGGPPKQAILFHLQDTFKINMENISENITEFAKTLEKIFGPGASYLEKLTVKNLHEKLGLEFENSENWDFLECINQAKNYSSNK